MKLLFMLLLPLSALALQQGWRDDRSLAAGLRANGVLRRTELANLYCEPGALTDAQTDDFAQLIDRGIREVATFAGVKLPDSPLNYFVSREVEISHSRGRSVYLPLTRVRERKAPYLHETVHAVVPCDECADWLNEGYASYVQSYLGEHAGGYDGQIFALRGNVGVDRDAVGWMRDQRGAAMLPYVGSELGDPDLTDRTNAAAPFYELAQSFVKYLVEKRGLKNPNHAPRSADLAANRHDWLTYLGDL